MYTRRLAVLAVLLVLGPATGLIHHLTIKDDSRRGFYIENFGFNAGGNLTLSVDSISPEAAADATGYVPSFVIRRTDTDTSVVAEDESKCLFETTTIIPDIVFPTNLPDKKITYLITDDGPYMPGLYSIFFANCKKEVVSFKLELVCSNAPDNYLSAGESFLPTMYLLFALAFLGCIIAWVYNIRRAVTLVFKIHHIMTVLLVLKFLTLVFLSIKYHYMKLTGHGNAFDVVYYIFAFMKGLLMFVVIALIGSGWAFVKPFLSDKDKKIFLVVIPLQIIDNIAMIVIDEMAPGSQAWLTWFDVLRLVDIICCGAILFPIVWSIKHLREASATDGKAQRSLEKLKLFRRFYIVVVSYIYFTRIIVYLLDATLPYRQMWMSQFSAEAAGLAFYMTVGWQFRPIENNPYFKVDDEDLEDTELGEVRIETSTIPAPSTVPTAD